jgi:hypothetical protein
MVPSRVKITESLQARSGARVPDAGLESEF